MAGAGGATLLATLAGYGMAKFDFPGKRAVFAIVLGAVAVPGTALAVPTFLLFSNLHLTNTPWAVILPSMVSPFGLYLIWVYASEACRPRSWRRRGSTGRASSARSSSSPAGCSPPAS